MLEFQYAFKIVKEVVAMVELISELTVGECNSAADG
jgi:hypothetical protein